MSPKDMRCSFHSRGLPSSKNNRYLRPEDFSNNDSSIDKQAFQVSPIIVTGPEG